MIVELTQNVDVLIDGKEINYEKGRLFKFHWWAQFDDGTINIPVAVIEDMESGQFVKFTVEIIKRKK